MIRVDHVSKRYGSQLAVDDVSFTIGAGEIVGFLGPNGAGKSTLLKLMSTWLEPSAGRIAIDGHDTQSAPLAVRRSLGYLTEHNALYDGMRVDRFLRFMGRARGLHDARLQERLAWVVDACTLQSVLGKLVRECSKGFRQRIGVAAALIHDPRVILLDEPTHGLDPLQVVAFREFVQGLREGRAVLFSSHILSEVLSISGRVLVIHHGRLLADRSVAALRAEASRRGVDVEQVVLDIVRTDDRGRDADPARAHDRAGAA
jgi:ABC-2 type transport system ATP-binding protein